MDISENLTQISSWILINFSQEQKRIELYLHLTRKDINALSTFPMEPDADTDFKKNCRSFNKLEKEYHDGTTSHKILADWMITLRTNFLKNATFV